MHSSIASCPQRIKWACVLLTLSCIPHYAFAAYTDSIFNKNNYYPRPWWAVDESAVPALANTALSIRTDAADPDSFSETIITALARGQRSQTGRAIGYMINSNSTFGGGCPVPAPPLPILQRFGKAMAAAITSADAQTDLWGDTLANVAKKLNTKNVTADSLKAVTGSVVADTILGGLFASGRSCTEPNALSSSLQSSVVAKYVDATCYYAGHILRALTANNTKTPPVFSQVFAADIKLANTTDKYVTSPVLQAYQKCMTGSASILEPPDWLGEGFASVSIDQQDPSGGTGASEGSVSGGGIASEGSVSGGGLTSGLLVGGSTSQAAPALAPPLPVDRTDDEMLNSHTIKALLAQDLG